MANTAAEDRDWDDPTPRKSDVAGWKSEAHGNESEFKRGYEGGMADAAEQEPSPQPVQAGGGGGTVKISNTKAGMTVAGLMAWSVMFALVGNEITVVKSGSAAAKAISPITEGGKIILGGTLGTAFLLMISHAGSGGQQLATGLALLTAVSSMVVWGKPVFGELSNLFGSKPTTPLTTTTLNTSPTPATTGATK
jgi:hypothetical protein